MKVKIFKNPSEENPDSEKPSSGDEVALVPTGYARGAIVDAREAYSYGPGSGSTVDVRKLWQTLRKRKWLIITLTLLATLLTAIVMHRTESTYQASAVVEVEPEHLSLEGTSSLESYNPQTFTLNLNTKKLMLRSRPLLEDVIADLKLNENEDFLKKKQSVRDILLKPFANHGAVKDQSSENQTSSTQSAVYNAPPVVAAKNEGGEHVAVEKTSTAPAVRFPDPLVESLDENLGVEQVRETRALKVSFTHTNPQIAAAVPNSVAQNFIERNYKGKTERFKNTAAWLTRETQDLKDNVRKAEQALATYIRERKIFSISEDKTGNTTLTTNKLADLHDQVIRAQADRTLKESLYNEVKAGRVEQLPEAFADPKMLDLRSRLSELETTGSELKTKYGPLNPQVKAVENQIAVVRQQLQATRGMMEQKLQNDFERAARNQQSFQAALDRSKTEAVQENQDSIQHNILRQDLETAREIYAEFLQKTNQANAQVAEQYNDIRIIEPAEVPIAPSGPKRALMIFVALFLSLVSAVGLAIFLDYLDHTIKSVEDINRYAQLPTIGVIPAIAAVGAAQRLLPLMRRSKFKAIIGTTSNGVPAANSNELTQSQSPAFTEHSIADEAYRVLRTSMLLSSSGGDGPPKTILVTSGQPGEGKTTTTINTAISLAQLGGPVLIIDCDLRKLTKSKRKARNGNHKTGLSTYLSDNIEVDEVIEKLPIPNLSLLSCGPIPSNPAELISSDKMKEMLRGLAERYDHILIDSPPLMHVTDPVILSTLVDGVILVVRGGKSTRDEVLRARQELAGVGAKMLGVVLNSVNLRRATYTTATNSAGRQGPGASDMLYSSVKS